MRPPALATSQVHQVEVYPAADAGSGAFDAATLATLAGQPHVSAAWGQLSMSGTFATGTRAGLVGSPPPALSAHWSCSGSRNDRQCQYYR